ncbi:MAG: addiction module toxin RelE [Prevotella sp.]|nr:addiction module toxin RelE [Prevotella sp.]
MNWTIEFTPDFSKGAKILSKRYKSFKDDLKDFKDSIIKNPFQGAELYPGIRKIRMPIAAKGKGKAGGARVITLTFYVSEEDGTVKFLIIYDKSDADTVDVRVVKSIVKDLGLNLESLQKEGRLQNKEDDK